MLPLYIELKYIPPKEKKIIKGINFLKFFIGKILYEKRIIKNIEIKVIKYHEFLIVLKSNFVTKDKKFRKIGL